MVDTDTAAMMEALLKRAMDYRAEYKYSEDEKMLPMAIIYSEKGIEIIGMHWEDNREKYQMAALANMEARKRKAKSLSFVTDARWVKSQDFCKWYNLDAPTAKNSDKFLEIYHRVLKAHGGEIKNLPREVWQEAVIVFTNGPGIPLTIQMQPYREGPNDSIEWLKRIALRPAYGLVGMMPPPLPFRDPEIGRELKASELSERTVVALGREDRDVMYTAWVSRIGTDYVAFLAGEVKTTFLARRDADDALYDDTGKRILVFQYLGEI